MGVGSPTSYRGDGYEFVELRAYVPGDDVRRIDWAATARAGELQTRVVLEDVALTLASIVDDTPSMRVGRYRPLLASAEEAARAWFGAALSGDRCVRVPFEPPFVMRDVLRIARASLRRGTALLVASDWYELSDGDHDLLANVARWCDCTTLVARDPWFDDLPLRGIVRMRGAEGGSVRAFVGRRERAAFAAAVREREARLRVTFERLGWRVGILHEADGAASLADAFGVPLRVAARR
jgi:uncharacterized protein (DUF58 family)